MSRRFAFLLGSCWLALLVGVDASLLLRPDTLKHYVDRLLRETFACDVEYEVFEGRVFEPLVLRRLRIPRPDDPQVLLAKVKALEIELDWASLLTGRPRVKEIVIRRPHLVLAWDTAGRLTLPSPFATRDARPDAEIPRLRVAGLELELLESPYLTGPREEVSVESLDLKLFPSISSRWVYEFKASLSDPELGELDASGHLGGNDYSIFLERSDVTLTPRLRSILRADLAAFFNDLDVEGKSELRSHFYSDKERGAATFRATARFDRVSIGYRDWPIRIEKLKGEIRYQDGHFEGDDLTADLESGRMRFGVDVVLHPGEAPEISLSGELLGLQLSDDLVQRIGELPGPGDGIREQLTQFAVRGPANVDFALGQERGGSFRPGLTVHLAGCEFVYQGPEGPAGLRDQGFPYALEDLWGAVEVDDVGLSFDRLTARRGPVSVRGRGLVNFGKEESSHDVRISLAGLRLDEDLWAALGEGLQETVKALDPRGYADVRVTIARPRGRPRGSLEVEADLLGIQLRPVAFPYAVDDLRGGMRIRDDRVHIEGVTARHGETELRFDGTVGIGARAGQVDLDLRARGMTVDADLVDAVAVPVPDAAESLRALRPEGEVDLELALSRKKVTDSIVADGTITLRGISVTPEEPAVRVENLDGVLALRGRDLRILEGMTGEISGERFNLGGQFRAGGGYQFQLQAQDFTVDDALFAELASLSPHLRDPERRPSVAGRADATMRVTRGSEGPVFVASVALRDLSLRHPKWPEGVGLEQMQGSLLMREGALNLQKVSARLTRPPELEPRPLPGPLATDRPFRSQRAVQLWVDSLTVAEAAEGLSLSFGEAMLSDVPLERWFLELLGLGPGGEQVPALQNAVATVGLTISSARVRPGDVTVSGGELRISGLHLGRENELYLEAGKITDFSCSLTPTRSDLEGELSGINLSLMGVPVPEFRGRFHGDRDGFTLTEISGILFGREPDEPHQPRGLIHDEATSLGLNWRTGQFALEAHLRDVQIGSALTVFGHRPRRIGGALAMNLRLGGVLGDPGSYLGSGRIKANTRYVIELPLFLNIIKALSFSSWLSAPPQTDITVDFTVGNRQVQLTKAELRAPDLDLRGTGTITFGGIIYAQLEVFHKGGIPVVSDIIGIVPSLLLSGIEVEGPLENPRVAARSLGTGGPAKKLPHGRRPVVKPLKKDE